MQKARPVRNGRLRKKAMTQYGQQEYMLLLIRRHGPNQQVVVDEFAKALSRGEVRWIRRTSGYTAEQYAQREWQDGIRKGWIEL